MGYPGYNPPKRACDYYVVLYCKRKKVGLSWTSVTEGKRTWSSLTQAEQQIFVDKFERWQAQEAKRMANILQHAEPFMKKRKVTKETNDETHKSELNAKDDADDNETQTMIETPPHIPDDNISNAVSESTNQETNDETHESEIKVKDDADDNETQTMIETPPHIPDDNISNAVSESTNQVYAASVIDPDVDGPSSHHITEPIKPTVKKGQELFETLKDSGTRPELANVEWKKMSTLDKQRYKYAVIRMNKHYLKKYEEYLESLSSEELFKHYIKKFYS